MSVGERTGGPGSHSGGQAAGIFGSVLYRDGISGISPRTWPTVRCSGGVLERRLLQHALRPVLQALSRPTVLFPGQLPIPGLRGTLLDPLPSGLSP